MLLLALASLLILLFEIFGTVSSSGQQIIRIVDFVIALIFLAEFIWATYSSDNRVHFLKKYWWELLAAIPITTTSTQLFRVLKIPRVIPVLETFRFFRFLVRLKIILSASKRITKQTTLIYLTITVGSILLIGASGFYYFENGINPNLHSFGDSLYWAITTTATVGSDISPVTTAGKFITVFLVFTGIGTLGAFITIIQSHIIKSRLNV